MRFWLQQSLQSEVAKDLRFSNSALRLDPSLDVRHAIDLMMLPSRVSNHDRHHALSSAMGLERQSGYHKEL
jgi:hypothetical protein